MESTSTPDPGQPDRRIDTDTGPFAIIPEWVLDLPVSDRAIRLYGILGRYADGNGRSWPSRRTLAERLNRSVDALDRAVKELVEHGALEVQARYDEAGDRTSNGYLLRRARPAPPPPGSRTPAPTGSRQPAATGSRQPAALTRANKNESQMEVFAPPTGVAATVRPLDPVWDTMLAVCGIDPAAITKSSRGAYNRAARDLRDLEATPQQIATRAFIFRRRWPEASLTPTALARRWPECDPDRQHATTPMLPDEITKLNELTNAWEKQ